MFRNLQIMYIQTSHFQFLQISVKFTFKLYEIYLYYHVRLWFIWHYGSVELTSMSTCEDYFQKNVVYSKHIMCHVILFFNSKTIKLLFLQQKFYDFNNYITYFSLDKYIDFFMVD